MKSQEFIRFKDTVDKNAFKEYYQSNGFNSTLTHYGLSNGNLRELVKEWNLYLTQEQRDKLKKETWAKKSTSKEKQPDNHETKIPKEAPFNYDKEDIIEYYNNHSRQETCEHYHISIKQLYRLLDGYKKPKDLVEHKCTRSHESYVQGGKKSAQTQKEMWGSKSEAEMVQWKTQCREAQLNMTDDAKKQRVEKTQETLSKKSDAEKIESNQKRSVSCKNYWNNLSAPQKCTKLESQLSKTVNTCMDKYGVPYNCMRVEARLKGNDSKPNKDFAELLTQNNIEFEREFTIDNYSYDFKVDDILIEINPSYTHNATMNPFGRQPINKSYHYQKTKVARNKGYQCINIWDWDDLDKVIAYIQPKITLYARNLTIKEITDQQEIAEFQNRFHFQGYCKNQSVCIGLYLEDELIELMTFGKPRYNKKYEYELIRLCTNSSFKVVGGAQKLFKHFVELYNPGSIISYCDNSKFLGKVYIDLGFILLTDNTISKHWYNLKTHKHITDNLLRQNGFDRLLGNVYGTYGKGTSNQELMLEHGFVEIYDSGQATFAWNNSKFFE